MNLLSVINNGEIGFIEEVKIKLINQYVNNIVLGNELVIMDFYCQ